jgi:hypothetical protein
MNVRRADWHPDCMVESPEGGWVHYQDFAALQRQLADYSALVAVFQGREKTAQKMIKDRDAQLAEVTAERDALAEQLQRIEELVNRERSKTK